MHMSVTHEQAATAQAPPSGFPATGRSPLLSPDAEREMADRARDGDHEAFDRIFAHYQTPIFNFVYRMMGDREDAHDLTQDAFLKAYLNLDRTRRDDFKLGPWLYRIATNVCIDELRHRKLVKWQPWEAFLSAFHPSQTAKDNPEREALDAEARREVRGVLEEVWRLPRRSGARRSPGEQYALVLAMKYDRDASYEEMAAALGTTRAGIKSLLFRARRAFREAWDTKEHDREARHAS
jgi:RNA polymerase sigma-70 factor (ECF subfamily)